MKNRNIGLLVLFLVFIISGAAHALDTMLGGIAGGGPITKVLVGPSGNVYIFGTFSSGGVSPNTPVASQDCIIWNGSSYVAQTLPGALSQFIVGTVTPSGALLAMGSQTTTANTYTATGLGGAWTAHAAGGVYSAVPGYTPGGTFLCLSSDIGGEFGGTLMSWNGTSWANYPAGQTITAITAYCFDSSGNLYVAGINGDNINGVAASTPIVSKWNGSSWSTLGTYPNTAGGPANAGMIVDSLNRLWILEYGGGGYLTMYDGSSWHSYSTTITASNASNAPSPFIVADGHNNVYFGGLSAGVGYFDGAAFHVQTVPGMNVNPALNSGSLDAAGNLYVGGAFGGTGMASIVKLSPASGQNGTITTLENHASAAVSPWTGTGEIGVAPFIVSQGSQGIATLNSTGNGLVYTPNTDANGTDSFTYQLNAWDNPHTVNVTITNVNQQPSTTIPATLVANEDSGLNTINGFASFNAGGNGTETFQSVLRYIVSNNNSVLFSVQPAIDTNGNLTFTTAQNVIGTATLTVQVQDNGGTANGGIDTSAAVTCSITVQYVNQPPTFTIGSGQSALRTAGPQSVASFLTNVSPGPANESSQTTTVTVTNDNNSLFSAQPTINGSGTLSYTPADSGGGVANVTVKVQDNGGTANGGVDTTTQTFTITIIPVNHVPSFAIGGTINASENSGSNSLANWATSISPGNFESTQAVNFIVSNSNTALFSTQPAISPTGTLTFVPAPNGIGTATLTVQIHDNGGTANGGVDTSASQSAVINVTSVPTLTISPSAISTNLSPIPFTFTFSESVNGFSATSFTVTNGTPGAFTGSGSTYSCGITPTADGPVTVAVAANVCNSVANGNGNLAASATVTSDRTPPTVAIAPSGTSTNTATITFAFTFSKPVTGFTSSSIQLINGNAGIFLGSGASYSLQVTPNTAGDVSVSIPAGSCTDLDGNGVVANVATVHWDNTPPIATITPSGGTTNLSPIPFTITFNKAVTGLTAGAFTGTFGTIGALTGSGTSYTLQVSPTHQGSIGLALAAGQATDVFGNTNSAANVTETYNTTAPTLLISPSGTRTNVNSINFTFTFSESVIGFLSSSISVTNGVAGTFSGSGSTYTLQVTPSVQGAVIVSVAAGACTDASGNGNVANSATVTYDTTPPTMVISPSNISTNASPIVFTLTASKTITGLTAGSFSIANGSAGLLTGSGANYTFSVTPSSNGTVTLALGANAFSDLAGNGNAPLSVSVISDRTPPTVAITPNGISTNQNPIPFTFTFSKAVTGVTASSITVTNGTAGTLLGSGTTYTMNVVPTTQAAVGVAIAAGAGTDAAGNLSLSGSASVTYDLTSPTLSITPNNTFTNTAPIVFTFTFSKAVVGFTATNITLTNGTPGTFSGSGASYTLGVNPTVEGAVTASVASGVVDDMSGNPNTAASASVTYDITPPTLSITPAGITTNASPITFTFSFSEPVLGFTENSISLTNGSKLSFNGSGSTYTLAVAPSSDGLVTASVAAAACTDRAGNPVAATAASVTSDRTPPGCTITPNGGSTNASPITFTLTFTKNVNGLVGSSLNIGNGTLLGFSGTGSIYSASVTPSADGAVVVSLPANVATDVDGNGNLAASASITSDRTKPTLAVSSSKANTNLSPITFNFLFSKPVTGFDSSKITLTNGTLSTFSGSGATYSISVIPITEGAVTAAAAANAGTDVDGNGSVAGSDTVTYDVTPPSLVIAPSGTATNANAFTVTFTFSETVSGFTSQSISVTNGTKGQLSGSSSAFSMIIAPISDGPVVISVANGACSDAAGNGCIGSNSTITSDRTAPTAAITPNGTSTNSSPIPMTITFSEPVIGLTMGALVATNGTISNFSGSGTTYTVSVTPTTQGAVTLSLPAGACTDLVGNANVANSSTVTYDTTPPSLTISPSGTLTNASPITFTLSWSKSVVGLTTSDFTATNGTIGTLSGTGANYSLTVTPLTDGVVTLTLPAHSVTDAAGNQNTQAFGSSVTSHRTPPTVTIAPIGMSTNATPVTLTITFTEAVTGFTSTGVSLTNATAGALSGSGAVYTLPVFPTTNGTVGVTVVQGAGVDAAGNLSVSAAGTFIFDTIAPTVIITPNGIDTNANSIAFAVTFSKSVGGINAADVVVTNGTLGAITGSGTTYSIPVSPTSDGAVTLTLNTGAGVDIAGNASTPGTATITSDRTPPTATISPTGTTINAYPIVFTCTFSEPVFGMGSSKLTLTNGTAGSFSGSGTMFTLQVFPATDGPVSVSLADNAVQDASGNGCIAATATVTSLRSPPTPTITPNGGATNVGTIAFTVTFPRAVTGFSASSLVVTNGAIGTITGTGPVYSVPVTPTSQGLVTVTLPAGAVTDAVGNANGVAQGLITYNTTPPVLTITPNSGIITTPTIVFSFSFSEIVTGFTASEITVSNGTAGTFTGSGANYSLVVTPTTDGTVSVAVGVGAATDTAGNGSTSATATVTSVRSAPSVTITGPGSPTNQSPMVITYTWSTTVNNFTAAGIQISNGTGGVLNGSGTVYTQAVTPTADGPVVITVTAGAAQNLVGTGNAQTQLTIVSDRTPPNVTITPNGTTTNASPITFTLTFSEPVLNLATPNITIANGTAGTLTGSGSLYTLTVTPLVDGAVIVSVPAGICTDQAGNGNLLGQATVTSNRSPPLPTITPNGTHVFSSPITFTVTWSKAVMNFTGSELNLTNGTVTAFSGTGTTYSVQVTPAGLGAVTMTVPSGVCTDTFGNLNATGTTTVTYTPPTQPVVTLPSGSLIYQRGASPIIIDGQASITDLNGLSSYDNGSLGVSISQNAEASDLITVIPGTYGNWVVSVTGPIIAVTPTGGGGSTTVGLVSGGSNLVDFAMTLDGSATPDVTVSLLHALGFSSGNVINQKNTVVKTLIVTFNDGSGVAPATAAKTITVLPVYPPPIAANATVNTLENQSYLGSLAGLWTDQGVTNPTVTYALVGTPVGGTVTAFDTVSGAYTFVPIVNSVANGSFSYTVTDQFNPSAPATITITVGAVNQPPSWTPGLNATVAENTGAYIGVGWASGISPGPANQSDETVSFAVTAANLSLFAVQPAISPTGTLTFTPATNQFGVSTVTAILTNSGGTANGGQNAAPQVIFTITVTQVIQAPSVPAITLYSIPGITVTAQVVISDPDSQLPAGTPVYQITGISQLGSLSVSGSGLITFTPTTAGSQSIPFTVSVGGSSYPSTIQLYANDLTTNRPLVNSTPTTEAGISGSAWSYNLAVDPASIGANDQLLARVQSADQVLKLAVVTQTSGNQFTISVPALDAGGGPYQSLTVIVTDLSNNLSDVQTIILAVAPPGGPG